MKRDQGAAAGKVVEARPSACPSCRSPWPLEPGHVVLGWAHCSCPTSRHGGHRRFVCLHCGMESLAETCTGQRDPDVSGWTR